MSFFSPFSKKSTTTNTTNNSYEDRSQNVGSGIGLTNSAIIDEGVGNVRAEGDISIQTLDPEVVAMSLATVGAANQEAFDFGRFVSGESLKFGRESLDFGRESLDFGRDALDQSSDTVNAALQTVRDSQAMANRETESARNFAANAMQSNAGLVNTLGTIAADSAKPPEERALSNLGKYAAIAAVVGILGLAYIATKKR